MPFPKSFRSREVFTFFLLERSISCGLTFKDCDSSCFILTSFLTTFPKSNFIQNLDFKRFFVYLWNDSNELKFQLQDKPILRTGQKSALQHSLFWRYANFSKLMRTIHISMTSTFQCEYCQCFTFKRCDKFKLNCCTSHGGLYSAHYFGKISVRSRPWML